MMEVLPGSGVPVGFYRDGFVGRLSLAENTATEFVAIDANGPARDIAQMTTKSVWMLVLGGVGVGAPAARLG
jgi:hypothetical protein